MFKQDEIIRLAYEAGFGVAGDPEYVHAPGYDGICTEELALFAKLVESKEREACAKACEEVGEHPSLTPLHCAESIRARAQADRGTNE